MNYLFTLALIAIAALFSACSPAKRFAVCIHPAVQNGMPFQIPEGAYFNRYGALVIKTKEEKVTLTGPVCLIREGDEDGGSK